RHLTAQATADAAVVHVRHGIAAQRVGAGLHHQRRATGEPDAGVIAGADLVVDAEARAYHPPAGLEIGGDLRTDAALAGELALAVGDDHLQALLLRAHRLAQGLEHGADVVGPDSAQPVHAHRLQGRGDVGRRLAVTAIARGVGNELRAGRRRVAVLHDDQHAVASIE